MNIRELVNLARVKLDDTDSQNYEWDDDEIVDFANQIIDIFCEEAYLIEDSTTTSPASLCVFSIVGGVTPTHTYTFHSSTVRVTRAYLATSKVTLDVRSVAYMDEYHPGWQSDTTQATPQIIIDEGIGTERFRLWPIPLVSETMYLTIFRRPITPLTITDLNATTPTALPIPVRYHHLLIDGMCWKAYDKNDEETEAVEKSELYKKRHEKNLETARRRKKRTLYKAKTVVPLQGNT